MYEKMIFLIYTVQGMVYMKTGIGQRAGAAINEIKKLRSSLYKFVITFT